MIRFESAEDLRRAGLIARTVSLRDVAVASIDAKRLVRPHQALTGKLSIEIEDEAAVEVAPDSATLWVSVRFSVAAQRGQGEEAQDVVRVSGTVDLEYDRILSEGVIHPEDAAVFAKINGTYNAWPYIRELAANTLVRLGFPPYTLESLVVAPQPKPAPTAEPAKPA